MEQPSSTEAQHLMFGSRPSRERPVAPTEVSDDEWRRRAAAFPVHETDWLIDEDACSWSYQAVTALQLQSVFAIEDIAGRTHYLALAADQKFYYYEIDAAGWLLRLETVNIDTGLAKINRVRRQDKQRLLTRSDFVRGFAPTGRYSA